MGGIRPPAPRHSIGHLVRDDNAAFSPLPHTLNAHIQAGYHAALALSEPERLRIAQFELAVGILHHLAVLVQDGTAMVVGGIELAPSAAV